MIYVSFVDDPGRSPRGASPRSCRPPRRLVDRPSPSSGGWGSPPSSTASSPPPRTRTRCTRVEEMQPSARTRTSYASGAPLRGGHRPPQLPEGIAPSSALATPGSGRACRPRRAPQHPGGHRRRRAGLLRDGKPRPRLHLARSCPASRAPWAPSWPAAARQPPRRRAAWHPVCRRRRHHGVFISFDELLTHRAESTGSTTSPSTG